MTEFQGEVISDTHLNLYKYNREQIFPIFPGTSPNLILAGDIGDPDEPSLHIALNIAREKYKRVIYIPGNHEFYQTQPGSKKTPASVLSWFQKLDDQWDNFHFFYRRQEVFDGIILLGATGWTTSPSNSTWSNMISEEGKKDIDFLEQGLSHSKEPVLIVTHYPSTLRIITDNFKNTLAQYNYAQDLERMYRYPLHTWIFGHIHQPHDFTIPYSSSMNGAGKVHILCNPYGYPSEDNAVLIPRRFTIPTSASVQFRGDTSYRTL
jgi:predicted phosphodiesterase